ncbi:hypothetical protein IWW50_004892, partial [Coemansia erecta]
PPGFFRDPAYIVDSADLANSKGEDEATQGKGSSGSTDDSESESEQPIAQQSMFALLGEEDC